jgi:hypothetical protein
MPLASRLSRKTWYRGGPVQTSGFARRPTAIHDATTTAHDADFTSAFLQWFDYIEFNSTYLFPTATLSSYSTLISGVNTARSALGYGWGDSKFSAYAIAFETGGQVNYVGTWSRSGTTLTLNLVTQTNSGAANCASTLASGGTGNVVLIGTDAAGNFTWSGQYALAASSSTANTFITVTVPNSGPTSGDAIGNVMVCYQNTSFGALTGPTQWLAANPTAYVHRTGTNGPFTAWTTTFKRVNMDITDNCTPDGSSKRWRDKAIEWYYDTIWNGLALQGMFMDNCILPRTDAMNGGSSLADFNHDGVQENRASTTVTDSWLNGLKSLLDKARSYSSGNATSPSIWTEANCDSGTYGLPGTSGSSTSGFYQGTNKVFIENVGGGSSDASRAGLTSEFATMVAAIQAAGPRLIPGTEAHVVLHIEPAGGTNGWNQKEVIRFWICTSWLFDKGMPKIMGSMSGTKYVPDEFKLGAGNAVDSEPTVADGNGLWKRRYQNLYVVVNPTAAAANLDLTGTSWKWPLGSDDPTTYPGGAAINGIVSIPARSGRVFVLNDSGV